MMSGHLPESSPQLSQSSIDRSWFQTIPPERIGLDGKYDHNGLAKRVKLAFNQQFRYGEVCNLKVRQRGAVVVLLGEAPSQKVLDQLSAVAMAVEGAAGIEFNGVSIVPASTSGLFLTNGSEQLYAY
ncbi:BON domain-containing protein [Leptolyngbya sp. AN02str]|uniref:BON domain-containing protein n=1 Tax=Leptolyngbya sp. AN02str TaxID=3423363 RepID=UPI003D3232C2